MRKLSNLPLRRVKPLSIAIPASILDDVHHLRDKTLIVGFIGRAASIFRVDEIIIYRDIPYENQDSTSEVIADILTYMETPQYLRRKLIPMKPSLRYAGILPPLRTPHHPTKRRFVELSPGEFREGIVVSSSNKRSLVDIGVERPAHIPDVKLPLNSRVTIQIKKLGKRILGEVVKKKEIKFYWGYKVVNSKDTLGSLLKKGNGKLIIATSRIGRDINEARDKLEEEIDESTSVLMLFGSPESGLHEIAKREKIKLEDHVSFVINFFKSQGTETVRTEEAIFGCLSIMNLILDRS